MKFKMALLITLLLALAIPASASSRIPAAHSFPSHRYRAEPILCAADHAKFIGQPYTYPGGTSGITQDVNRTNALGIVDYTDFVKNVIEDSTASWEPFDPTLNPASDTTVVLLIVDDFETPVEKETPSDGVPTAPEPKLLPHGEYVYQAAQQLLEGTFPGGTDISPLPDGTKYARSYAADKIVLSAVDVPHYHMGTGAGEMQGEIERAINSTKAPSGTTHFVINMSFAVVPCEMIVEVGPIVLTVDLSVINPSLRTGDLIVEYSDSAVSGWQIVSMAAEGAFASDGLAIGDIIRTFDGAVYDKDELWFYLFNFDPGNSPGTTLGCEVGEISIETVNANGDTKTACVPAVDIYKAVTGDSISLRLTQMVLENGEIQAANPACPTCFVPGDWMNTQRVVNGALAEAAILYEDIGPLQTWIQDDLPKIAGSNSKVIAVAAAGNFDSRSPFAPGLWPEVISVSSSIDKTAIKIGNLFIETAYMIRWMDSSSGELMAPGGWYEIPCTYGSATPRCEQEFVSGTSFAAPATSIIVALSLINPSCPGDYGDYMDGPFTDPFFSKAICR